MKYLLKLFLIIFLFKFSNVHSTSTSFEQNLIISDKSQTSLNFNQTSSNIQSLALTSYIGIFGKKLYDNGFFSPLGLLPEQIKNLSPLAYKDKIDSRINLISIDWCNSKSVKINQSKEKVLNFEVNQICDEPIIQEKNSSYKNLIDRYLK